MGQSIHTDDHTFQGTLTVNTALNMPASTVDDTEVATGTTPIGSPKLEQQYSKMFSQESATAASDVIYPVHEVRGSVATALTFTAGSVAAAVGDSTCTVDLLKNGTTMLSAVITLDNANTARVSESGTLSVTSLVVGDLIEIKFNATIGTGTLPTGVFATVRLKEYPT